MAVRPAALLPRALVVPLVWVLGTSALTFAADTTAVMPPPPSRAGAAPPAPDVIVPSVTGQAYVFAKGILEDAGFAWRVAGPVRGYAANRVLAQAPAAGTGVKNTGAPTIVLHLVRGPYGEHGTPADFSPYLGTPVRLAARAAAPAQKPAVKPVVKEAAEPPAQRKRATVRRKKPAAATKRPPAFRPAGAPAEPLNEIALPARARRLEAWVETRPTPTNANIQHWLYQHAWIVTGARFGWWHGDNALVTLIRVDRRVERLWGIGYRSEASARAALAYVRRESR
jgi:PASTA domain